MSLIANLEHIKSTLPPNVQLVVVTKNQSPETITSAIKAGAHIIAENRIQEASRKFPHIPAQSTLPHERHFIGHLQTNKTREAVQLFDMIQSVDSLRLARKINNESEKANKNMPILLQVNIANDTNKYGLTAKELPSVLNAVQSLPHLELRGLMTIVPFHENPEKTRPYFSELRQLAITHNLKELSMGMSHDHTIAIQEGATMVRLGRALFEANNQSM
jgi:PLP dependent protein